MNDEKTIYAITKCACDSVFSIPDRFRGLKNTEFYHQAPWVDPRGRHSDKLNLVFGVIFLEGDRGNLVDTVLLQGDERSC
jgi:hypothetical protein